MGPSFSCGRLAGWALPSHRVMTGGLSVLRWARPSPGFGIAGAARSRHGHQERQYLERHLDAVECAALGLYRLESRRYPRQPLRRRTSSPGSPYLLGIDRTFGISNWTKNSTLICIISMYSRIATRRCICISVSTSEENFEKRQRTMNDDYPMCADDDSSEIRPYFKCLIMYLESLHIVSRDFISITVGIATASSCEYETIVNMVKLI